MKQNKTKQEKYLEIGTSTGVARELLERAPQSIPCGTPIASILNKNCTSDVFACVFFGVARWSDD